MKKILNTVIVLVLFITTSRAQATTAEQLADRMAKNVADSITLTTAQKKQLYNINMQLHNRKMDIRKQYAGGDSLRIEIQRVENTRDSLYRTVLPDEKYFLYKEKKKTLISNN